jgi:hypothetical protein
MLNLNIFLKTFRSIVGCAPHFRTTGQRREFVPAAPLDALGANLRCMRANDSAAGYYAIPRFVARRVRLSIKGNLRREHMYLPIGLLILILIILFLVYR